MNTTNETSTYTLTRTGLPPIRFSGTLIGSRDTREPQNCTRWTEWTIYSTTSGRWILNTRHVSQWANERTSSEVWTFTSPDEMIDYVRAEYDDHVPDDLSFLLERVCPDSWIETV